MATIQWTRESIDEALIKLSQQDLQGLHDLWRRIAMDLLAHIEATEQNQVVYRLPDSLGGLPLRIIETLSDGTVDVEVISDLLGRIVLNMDREKVVEVVPPSIDSPVSFPVRLTDADDDTLTIKPFDTAIITDADVRRKILHTGAVADVKGSVYLSREQCVTAACALWKLAMSETIT